LLFCPCGVYMEGEERLTREKRRVEIFGGDVK
jgi:hypothetical protein